MSHSAMADVIASKKKCFTVWLVAPNRSRLITGVAMVLMPAFTGGAGSQSAPGISLGNASVTRKNTMLKIINSPWLAVVLLVSSLGLALSVEYASLGFWFLALLGGCISGVAMAMECKPFTPREFVSTVTVTVGNMLSLYAIFIGPQSAVQVVAFFAGVVALRQAVIKGLLPWIQ
ncbi:hypothetical protein SERVES_00711 [Serratia ficaria]|nr:hypothetical protein SERVES_00711 [Serratia ficaria]